MVLVLGGAVAQDVSQAPADLYLRYRVSGLQEEESLAMQSVVVIMNVQQRSFQLVGALKPNRSNGSCALHSVRPTPTFCSSYNPRLAHDIKRRWRSHVTQDARVNGSKSPDGCRSGAASHAFEALPINLACCYGRGVAVLRHRCLGYCVAGIATRTPISGMLVCHCSISYRFHILTDRAYTRCLGKYPQ